MVIDLRPATLEDVTFLADVVITATLAQGRFPPDADLAAYRAGFEDWTRETILGAIPGCTLSVIQYDGDPVGRLRVVRTQTSITLAGIQLLPEHQNRRIGSTLIEQLMREADRKQLPLLISVEKDNPRAQLLYERLGCRIIGQDEQEYHLEYRPDTHESPEDPERSTTAGLKQHQSSRSPLARHARLYSCRSSDRCNR